MASGHLAEARTQLELADHDAPNNPQVCLVWTQFYARTKDEQLRRQAAQRCIEFVHRQDKWEESATIRNYLGKVYLANALPDVARAEFSAAAKLEPYEEAYRFDLAQTLLNHERFADAVEVLEDARKVFDKSAQIELALGVAYYGQRRFPEAVEAFLRTIQLDAEIAQPYIFLGKMLDQAGDRLPEVRQRFEEFQKANPRSYLGPLLLAKAIGASSNDGKQQETLLRQSIELKQDNWENHYLLGVLFETRHDYEASRKELKLSSELNPGVADIHYHLARVYDRLNVPQEAAAERKIHAQLTSSTKSAGGMEVNH